MKRRKSKPPLFKMQRAVIGCTGHEGPLTKAIQTPDLNGIPILRYREETPKERNKRERVATRAGQAILDEIFKKLSWNLGPVEANKMFAGAAKLPSHRRKGTSNHSNEVELLAAYDCMKESFPDERHLVKIVAERLNTEGRGAFGLSADAIAKHIRRLLRQRKLQLKINEEVILSLSDSHREVLAQKQSRRTKKDRKSST